jgi:hypothetical protein
MLIAMISILAVSLMLTQLTFLNFSNVNITLRESAALHKYPIVLPESNNSTGRFYYHDFDLTLIAKDSLNEVVILHSGAVVRLDSLTFSLQKTHYDEIYFNSSEYRTLIRADNVLLSNTA